MRLDDLILRRTLMGMLGDVSLPLLEELAAIPSVLEWSQQDARAEVERTVDVSESTASRWPGDRSPP